MIVSRKIANAWIYVKNISKTKIDRETFHIKLRYKKQIKLFFLILIIQTGL